MKTRRQHILGAASDLMADFLYYDRKECEDIPMGAIEEALRSGEVTSEEIAAMVKGALDRAARE